MIALRPDRVALYSYAHLPDQIKAQRQLPTADLPTAETKFALLRQAIEMLTAAGYVSIGMDHFALPNDDLVRALRQGRRHRNFQAIPLIASAISSLSNSIPMRAPDLDLDQGRIVGAAI